MQLGMPYIQVSNMLHFDYSGFTPLCLFGWPHETTPTALARNREGVAKITEMLAPASTGVRAWAERAGLKIDWEDLSSTISPLAWITQTPRAFDFESSHWPPQFHHTGPFIDGQGREKVDFPWERLTGEPVIYASMGTLMNGRAEVFRTIAAAVGRHKDLQLVLSIGDQLDPKQIGPVPSNAIVVQQAPQLELLKRATVCITHAGLNTVLESLAQGVPQLAIPITYDQPGVAARIAHKKTGVVTSLAELNADQLFGLRCKTLWYERDDNLDLDAWRERVSGDGSAAKPKVKKSPPQIKEIITQLVPETGTIPKYQVVTAAHAAGISRDDVRDYMKICLREGRFREINDPHRRGKRGRGEAHLTREKGATEDQKEAPL
jgi:hypothetical protein